MTLYTEVKDCLKLINDNKMFPEPSFDILAMEKLKRSLPRLFAKW